MNEITVFNNPEFGNIRTTKVDGEPWFVGKDIANALGYANSRDAIKTHVDEEDKGRRKIDTLGGKQTLTVINESGLYAMVFGSELDNAKRFKRWVTSEVIPAIREDGMYMTPQKAAEIVHGQGIVDVLLQAAEELKKSNLVIVEKNRVIAEQAEEITECRGLIGEMEPKALFADAVATSKTSILIGDLAKLLKQNGYDTGQKRLFKQLRDEGYLIKRKGADYNSPTQYAMELGLFEIKESTHVNADGVTITTKTTKVTGKGQIYFLNRFCEMGARHESNR